MILSSKLNGGLFLSTKSESIKLLMVKCPKCNKTLNLKVDLDLLEYVGGIAKVAIFHGSPPHSLILYIDRRGMIRGTEVAEFVVLMDKREKALSKEEIEKLRDSLGSESLSALFSSYIANMPLYVVSQTSPTVFKRVLEGILGEFFPEVKVISNTIAEEFEIVIVNDDFYRNTKDKINGLVFDMQSGWLLSNVSLKYMKKLVNRYLENKKRSPERLKTEIKELKRKYDLLWEEIVSFKNFFKVIKGSTRRISLKKLKSRFNLSNSETKFLIELIKIRDNDVHDIIKDDIGIF